MKMQISQVSKNCGGYLTPANSDILELTLFGKLENRDDFDMQTIEKFRTLLKKNGVELLFFLDEQEDYIWFKFSAKTNPRKAGRKIVKQENEKYTQLDILTLLCTHSNKEVFQMLDIPESTYYRAKKKLQNSSMYKAIQEDGNLKNHETLSKNRNQYTANDGKIYFASKFLN